MGAKEFGGLVDHRMAELGISQRRLAMRLGELSDGRIFEATQIRLIRHTGAQAALAAKKGRNLEDVRELLGHASSHTTMGYLRGFSWDVASAVEGIVNPLND
jgi:integrase